MNTKTLSKISLIINKMGISSFIDKVDLTNGVDTEVVGKEIAKSVLDNFYKAENEIVDLISCVKQITKEEAENYDVIDFVMELLKNDKIKSFLNLM